MGPLGIASRRASKPFPEGAFRPSGVLVPSSDGVRTRTGRRKEPDSSTSHLEIDMNRLFLLTAAALTATGLAAAPAVAGLAHNPSFSHQLPVRAPSGAQTLELGDDAALMVRSAPASTSPA